MLAGRNGADVDEFDNQLNDPGQYDNPQDPASLSVVEHLRALSIRGKLTLLYVAGVIVFVLCTLDWVSPSVAPSARSLHYICCFGQENQRHRTRLFVCCWTRRLTSSFPFEHKLRDE